jgi:hypothetical protein
VIQAPRQNLNSNSWDRAASLGGRFRCLSEQIRQLGDVGCYAPCLVSREQIRRRPSPRQVVAAGLRHIATGWEGRQRAEAVRRNPSDDRIETSR